MINNPDDFFTQGCGRCDRHDTPDCSTRQWLEGLLDLRRICLNAGLTETAKWGHPCYVHAGRNIVIMGAFRNDFRLSFFNAALMKDPQGVLEKQGPNTLNPDMIRFTHNEQVAAQAPIIRSYLKEAMMYAENGIKPARSETELELPRELLKTLEADPALAEAFYGLTPGRQKSYVINLNSAKQPATRYRRIAGFREKILAGKGAHDY